MSDYDWQRLSDERDRVPEQDGAEWLDALCGLDDPDEWERALDADPLMMFHRLPEQESGPADIEAMKQAVASMRRTHELESKQSRSAIRERTQRWALAALLTLGVSAATLMGSNMVDRFDADGSNLVAADEVLTASLQWSVPMEIAQLPLVEDVDPEMGPWIQIEGDGMSLVVVMNADVGGVDEEDV